MHHKHHLLSSRLSYSSESEKHALARYNGFAHALHESLYRRHPSLRGKFIFYKDGLTDDIWSICETGSCSFGVQLDADTECICLWDDHWSVEIGSWCSSPIDTAIATIESRYTIDNVPSS